MSDANPGTGGTDDGPPLPLPVTNDGSSHPVLDEVITTAPPPASGGLPIPAGPVPNASTIGDLPQSPEPKMADTSGGGYRFSPEQLENIISQWKDLRDDLRKDLDLAEKLKSTEPPGHEFASGDFIARTNASGRAYYQLHERMLDYVQKYIEKLEDAKKALGAAEDHAAQDITQAGAQQT